MYAGFELCESVARPGAEENIDNEKFEYKNRDWAAAEKAGTSLAPYITQLNSIRAAHPALGQLRNIDFHRTDDDAILCYSKHLGGEFTGTGVADTIIVVANTDPHAIRETTVHLDMPIMEMPWDAEFVVRDLLTGQEYDWRVNNYVRLDPHVNPVHIFAVERR
jgi:starch synthase (maltosyl-transferring)